MLTPGLACCIITDIPNLENLLLCNQEKIRYSRWITTANGCLRELVFDCGNLTEDQKKKLKKIVLHVLCVYVPSFAMIHLHLRALESPFLTLFQRDLLFAYCEIALDITNLLIEYHEKSCLECPR